MHRLAILDIPLNLLNISQITLTQLATFLCTLHSAGVQSREYAISIDISPLWGVEKDGKPFQSVQSLLVATWVPLMKIKTEYLSGPFNCTYSLYVREYFSAVGASCARDFS